VKRAILIAPLLLSLAAGGFAQTAAPLTTDTAFDDLVAKNPAQPPAADLIALYLASTAGVTVPSSSQAQFIAAANNTRTDVQLGATPNSPASTTLVEKPAAADILSLAVERGAVTPTTDGTALTLSTTPYLLGGFIGVRDSPQNWRDYALLRHVSLAATFANATDVQQKGEFSSISSGEIKWIILGNRSPRDMALHAEFAPLLAPGADADIAKTKACQPVTALPVFQTAFIALASAPKPVTAASVRTTLGTATAGATFTAEQQTAIASCAAAVAGAQNTFNGIAVRMGALTNAYLSLNQQHQFSVAGSAHRDATIDDYTTIKLLYGNNAAPKLSLNLNGEVDFNQHATHKKLHSVRSFAIEAGSTIGRFNEGRFDATISAKLWRSNDTQNKNVGVFQLKGNVYLSSALALPISISFANQPVETIQKGWQINLGVASLLDAYLTGSLKTP
jgi:hypothetical protein